MAKDLKFMTLNIQGLRTVKKRKTREDKISFAALQETFLTNEDLNILQKNGQERFIYQQVLGEAKV